MFIRYQCSGWCHADFCEAAHDERPVNLQGVDNLLDWFATWRAV